jgi:hypothetical protein
MQNLYWSHIKMMRECPRKYLWSKGHPGIDLGAGEGKPKPLPPEEQRASEHHMLMGDVLSKVVENIYNHEMWRKGADLKEAVEEMARKEFVFLEQRRYCLWQQMTRQQAIDICVSGAVNFLKIMKENRLLGVWNKSEFKMTPSVNKYFSACGIADLIFRDKEDRVYIMDGKNAMTPGKYEDPDQLRWYALCFRLQYGITPHKLGFFYFRYPSDNPPEDKKDWTGMVEVDLTPDDLKRLAAEGVETSKAIHRGHFEPNPVPKHCTQCPYESLCEERQAQKKHNAAKRGLGKSNTPDPFTEVETTGFLDLSFKK